MTSYFTCFVFLFTSFSLNAQINTISTGSGYSKQSFYNLATQEEFQLNNDAWDIAFSNIGQTDAGVFINESASSTGTPLKLFLASTTDWGIQLNDVSIYVDSVVLYNKELNWIEGAFNTIADPTSPFDYGWGAYNPQNHSIQGTKIFVIKGRDGSFKKIQISSLQGGNYTIKYSDLNGANEVTKTIAKSTEQYGSTIFFSLKTGEVVATPKEYDLMFLRYYAPLDAGNGEILEYAVTGILLASGVEAVNVTDIDPEMVDEADYKDQYQNS